MSGPNQGIPGKHWLGIPVEELQKASCHQPAIVHGCWHITYFLERSKHLQKRSGELAAPSIGPGCSFSRDTHSQVLLLFQPPRLLPISKQTLILAGNLGSFSFTVRFASANAKVTAPRENTPRKKQRKTDRRIADLDKLIPLCVTACMLILLQKALLPLLLLPVPWFRLHGVSTFE